MADPTQSANQPQPPEPQDARWPVGSRAFFTDEFLRHAMGVEKREGEFDFGGATWQVRETYTDDDGYVSYRCERVR